MNFHCNYTGMPSASTFGERCCHHEVYYPKRVGIVNPSVKLLHSAFLKSCNCLQTLRARNAPVLVAEDDVPAKLLFAQL